MKLIVIMVLAIAFLPISVSAQSFPQWQDKYVNDFAGFLDSASVSQLRGLLSELEQNTTAEVVVVTVQTTAPLPRQQYRTELFNNWKIGKAANDNGLLILYVASENKIEVETGYGLEGILPDSKVGSILDEFYVPYRYSNRTVLGIVLATQEFARVINANAEEVRTGNAGKNIIQNGNIIYFLLDNFPFIIIIFFVLIPFILSSSLIAPKCKKCGKRMKYVRFENGYEIYRCENGHELKRKKSRYGGLVVAGGLGGGGWGGGGGGFGGGGSGGGGAGR